MNETLNSFFDHIYCVNLDKRTDRWQECLDEFSKNGIENVERFSAVDGDTIPTSEYSFPIRKGNAGFALSHINLLKDAIEKGYKNFLMFEDDVEFTDNFVEKFNIAIKDLPENWDILYLGGNHAWGVPSKITENLSIANNTLAMHAIAINSSVYQSLLDVQTIHEPTDVTYSKNLYRFNSFVFTPSLAWQRPSWSDIEEANVDYGFLK
jgi:GR25 family glycosyltransferase involved in LPS biosynthesis